MTRQKLEERAFDVGKGKYWPNFFTETFAMKKRLLIKVEITYPKKYLKRMRQRIAAFFFRNKLGTGKNLTDIRVAKKADRSKLFSRYWFLTARWMSCSLQEKFISCVTLIGKLAFYFVVSV